MIESSTPTLSIVIPNYNYGSFLSILLDSINKSKHRESIEVIVVDGGSTDNSVENAKQKLLVNDTLISEKDKGQADAISKGLKVARGAWFIFQNSDDLFEVSGLDACIDIMKGNIDSDMIVGGYGLCVNISDCWKKELNYIPVYGIKRFMLLINLYFPNQCTFYVTKLAKTIDFDVKKKFALDLDFTVRYITQHGLNYLVVPAIVGYLRLHADSKTSNMQQVCSAEVEEIHRINFNLFDRLMCYLYYPGYLLYSFLKKKQYRYRIKRNNFS